MILIVMLSIVLVSLDSWLFICLIDSWLVRLIRRIWNILVCCVWCSRFICCLGLLVVVSCVCSVFLNVGQLNGFVIVLLLSNLLSSCGWWIRQLLFQCVVLSIDSMWLSVVGYLVSSVRQMLCWFIVFSRLNRCMIVLLWCVVLIFGVVLSVCCVMLLKCCWFFFGSLVQCDDCQIVCSCVSMVVGLVKFRLLRCVISVLFLLLLVSVLFQIYVVVVLLLVVYGVLFVLLVKIWLNCVLMNVWWLFSIVISVVQLVNLSDVVSVVCLLGLIGIVCVCVLLWYCNWCLSVCRKLQVLVSCVYMLLLINLCVCVCCSIVSVGCMWNFVFWLLWINWNICVLNLILWILLCLSLMLLVLLGCIDVWCVVFCWICWCSEWIVLIMLKLRQWWYMNGLMIDLSCVVSCCVVLLLFFDMSCFLIYVQCFYLCFCMQKYFLSILMLQMSGFELLFGCNCMLM